MSEAGTLGDYLRSLRLKRGLTYAQMAKEVGTSKSYIWEVENNISSPSLLKAKAMAVAYRTTLNKMCTFV